MHAARSRVVNTPDIASCAIHDDQIAGPVLGRLVERGLHDELAGTAYAVVEGVDGRTHHLRFSDIDMTGDARPGAIVELRSWEDHKGQQRHSLTTRSDLPLDHRSEEHTSELQSLMRISYAVFCLKKKHNKNTKQIQT